MPTAENYSADRLGDDVLAVLDALHLVRPLLVGHSLAGEELSSIGSRRPERVAGLVYLDAGYRYALSAPGLSDLQIDAISMRRYLADMLDDVDPADAKRAADALLAEWPAFQAEVKSYSDALAKAPPMKAQDKAAAEAERATLAGRSERAVLDQEQRFSTIRCPALVVFAYPHALPASLSAEARAQREKSDTDFVDQRLKLFRAQPQVTVLLLPHATHDVQDSRREEVLHALETFPDGPAR